MVDDNEDGAHSFVTVLQSMGHAAQAVIDPRRALAAALSGQPHIAFIDIGMPHMNGFELAATLRAHFPPEKRCIVAITGYAEEKHRISSRKAGIDAHLTKPVDPAMVEHIIEVVCPQLSPPPG